MIINWCKEIKYSVKPKDILNPFPKMKLELPILNNTVP